MTSRLRISALLAALLVFPFAFGIQAQRLMNDMAREDRERCLVLAERQNTEILDLRERAAHIRAFVWANGWEGI